MTASLPVIIRPAAPPDIGPILSLERQSPGASHWSAQQYEHRLNSGLLLLAEEASTVVGFLCAREAAGEWELENIVVVEQSRRRAVGAQLLRALVDVAEKKRAALILLEVRESNLAARRFYEKHQFRETGRRRLYYRQPDEDAVLYQRSLAQP